MPTLISGSRTITSKDFIYKVLEQYDITTIIQGGAKGVDSIAKQYAIDNEINNEEYPANWNEHGKKAGMIRNAEMINKSTNVIAFWDGVSKGTRHAILTSIKKGKKVNVHYALKVYVYYYDEPKAKDVETLNLFSSNLLNKYEALEELKDNYSPLGNFYSIYKDLHVKGNLNLLWALETFLANKCLVMIKVKPTSNMLAPLMGDNQLYALDIGATSMEAFIISSRIKSFLYPEMQDIIHLSKDTLNLLLLKDDKIDKAVDLLSSIDKQDSFIVNVTDSDHDGQGSGAIATRYFKSNGYKFISFINKRSKGNGVNNYLVDKITKHYFEHGTKVKQYVIITSDHGTHDGPRYKELKALGDNVIIIVTDHHLLDNGKEPPHVDAFVNPQDPLSSLPSYICGGVVLYALLLRFEINKLEGNLDTLNYLLPYCATTTVGDMMDLSKPLNRYLYNRGVDKIKESKFGTFEVFKTLMPTSLIITDSLSRGFIPQMNSCNRMDNPQLALDFLTSSSYEKANLLYKQVDNTNNRRKALQRKLVNTIPTTGVDGKYSVAHCLDTSVLKAKEIAHAGGVIGVVANMLPYGKPTFIGVPLTDEHGQRVIKMSGRGIISNVHLLKAVNHIKENHPEFHAKGGGHAKACGITIHVNDSIESTMNKFKQAFDDAIYAQTKGKLYQLDNNAVINIEPNVVNMGLLTQLEELNPFGNGYPPIKFAIKGLVTKYREVNSTMVTFKIIDPESGYRVNILCFDVTQIQDVEDNKVVTVTGQVSIDSWGGNPVLIIQN